MNYKLEILKNLKKKRSREFWKEFSRPDSFVDHFAIKENTKVYELPKLDSFNKEGIMSFFVDQCQGTLHLFGETLYQFGIFHCMSEWMSHVSLDLGIRSQTSAFTYEESFTTPQSIEEIENGEWSEEAEAVLFDTEIGKRLDTNEYFVNFVSPSIRLVRQSENTFSIYTYRSEPVLMDIEVIPEGLSEFLLSPNKRYLFRKSLRIELPPFRETVFLDDQYLFVHSITIKNAFQYKDSLRSLDKSITLKPMRLKEDASKVFLRVREETGSGKIKYRFYQNNNWTSWRDYEDVIQYKNSLSVLQKLDVRPWNNQPNIGRLWVSGPLYDGKFNFVPQDSLILRDCNSELSWKKGAHWEINVWNAEERTLRLDKQEIYLNSQKVTGTIKILPGFANIKVPAKFIYISDSEANDIYFPNNIYHQISGGIGYSGFNITFRTFSSLVSNTELLYGSNSKRKHSFAIKDGQLHVLVSAEIKDFYSEEVVFITNQNLDEGNTLVQIKIEFPREFYGSVTGYGVDFK